MDCCVLAVPSDDDSQLAFVVGVLLAVWVDGDRLVGAGKRVRRFSEDERVFGDRDLFRNLAYYVLDRCHASTMAYIRFYCVFPVINANSIDCWRGFQRTENL